MIAVILLIGCSACIVVIVAALVCQRLERKASAIRKRVEDKRKFLYRDALARQKGENLDGSPRRETKLTRYPPVHTPPTTSYGARYDSRPDPRDYMPCPGARDQGLCDSGPSSDNSSSCGGSD